MYLRHWQHTHMKRNEISKIIRTFVKDNLMPTDEEISEVSSRYDELKEILLGVDIFQSGSYARHTSTTPVNDLDVIWVIPRSYLRQSETVRKAIDADELDIDDLLADLAQKLLQEYKSRGEEVRVEQQSHSVGIYFGSDDEFSIDVVPAVETPEKSSDYNEKLYEVPSILNMSHKKRRSVYKNNAEISWIKSDPLGYKAQAKDLSDATAGGSRVATRLVKKWRSACRKRSDSFKLKSFHLEMIVTEYLKENVTDSVFDAVEYLFLNLPTFLISPLIKDRSDSMRFIDEYVNELTDQERICIQEEKDAALLCIKRIRGSVTTQDVIEALKELTGLEDSSRPLTRPSSSTVSGATLSRPWLNN